MFEVEYMLACSSMLSMSKVVVVNMARLSLARWCLLVSMFTALVVASSSSSSSSSCRSQLRSKTCQENVANLLLIVPTNSVVYLVTRDWLVGEVSWEEVSYGQVYSAYVHFKPVEKVWRGLAENERFRRWCAPGSDGARLVHIYPIDGWIYFEPSSGSGLRYNPQTNELSIEVFFQTHGHRYRRIDFNLIGSDDLFLFHSVEYDRNREAIGRFVPWKMEYTNAKHEQAERMIRKAVSTNHRYFMYRWDRKKDPQLVLTRQYVRDENILNASVTGEYLQGFLNWTVPSVGFVRRRFVHLIDPHQDLVHIFGLDAETFTADSTKTVKSSAEQKTPQMFRLITSLRSVKMKTFFQCNKNKTQSRKEFPVIINHAKDYDIKVDPSQADEDLDGYKALYSSDPLGLQRVLIIMVLIAMWMLFTAVSSYFFYKRVCHGMLRDNDKSQSNEVTSTPQTLAGIHKRSVDQNGVAAAGGGGGDVGDGSGANDGLMQRLFHSLESRTKLNKLRSRFIKSRQPPEPAAAAAAPEKAKKSLPAAAARPSSCKAKRRDSIAIVKTQERSKSRSKIKVLKSDFKAQESNKSWASLSKSSATN